MLVEPPTAETPKNDDAQAQLVRTNLSWLLRLRWGAVRVARSGTRLHALDNDGGSPMSRHSPLARLAALSLTVVMLAGGALATGCGSSAPAGATGGAVPDAADQHCVVNGALAPTKVGMCVMPAAGGADGGSSQELDGGDDGGPGVPSTDYGPPLYNQEGYDDDCKYHVSFTSTPIREGADVTFTVTVASLDPAGPATGAKVYADVFLTAVHPAPISNPKTTETPGAGVYEVGPFVFDASGRWTVRFHMNEMCSDAPADSPHGHAAFYVDVP